MRDRTDIRYVRVEEEMPLKDETPEKRMIVNVMFTCVFLMAIVGGVIIFGGRRDSWLMCVILLLAGIAFIVPLYLIIRMRRSRKG